MSENPNFGNQNPNFKNDLQKVLNFVKGLGVFGVIIVIGLYMATGTYQVGPDEEGVIKEKVGDMVNHEGIGDLRPKE